MIKKVILSLLLTMFTVAVTVAEADEIYNSAADIKPGRFQTYQQSSEMLASLNQVGQFWDKLLGIQQDCQGRHEVRPIGLVILDPVAYVDAADYPTRGIWKVQFEYVRCKEFKTYNAIFMAKGGDKPDLMPAIPGYSDASPALALDTIKAMFPQAQEQLGRVGAPDCKLIYPFEARMTPAAVAKPFAESWQEKWTFQGCGKYVDFLMTFSPKASDGKYFSASPLH